MPERERTGVICRRADHILTIEQQDPLTHKRFWTFPGGEIENDETPEECAVRETLEETGYRVRLTSEDYVNQYQFRWNGKLYDCTTHWFLAESLVDAPEPVADASYILQSVWLPWPAARPLFQFNQGVTDAVDTLLQISSPG